MKQAGGALQARRRLLLEGNEVKLRKAAVPSKAFDWDEAIDFIDDIFKLFSSIVDFFRNLGQYMTGD